MPDLTSLLLPRMRDHTLPGLDLDKDFIHPNYEDQSILNIPSTICRWLDLPEFKTGPLVKEIYAPLLGGIHRVVLILIDGLAFHRFQNWMEYTPVWKSLVSEGILAPLTSVVPSTTDSALTSLWTGASPASHGIIGYEMLLKEYGLVANMISHSPIAFKDSVGSLGSAGFSPERFLKLPTFGSHLWNHAVKSYSYTHYSIANSGLSRMLMRDVELQPFSTSASLWVSLRKLIENKPDGRMYLWTYFGQVDGISHRYGPDNERSTAEFSHFSQAFEQFFLNKLSPSARKGTLVILTADHGQVHTPLKPRQVLANHPDLSQHLCIKPTCENRFAFLYLRPGRENAVREYFSSNFPDQFSLITPNEAINAGLFGPGPYHSALLDRIGDLIVIARDNSYLWWSEEDDFLLGRHGGLHPHELLVPFLAVRL
jgi:hypothetical protein